MYLYCRYADMLLQERILQDPDHEGMNSEFFKLTLLSFVSFSSALTASC